MSAALFIVTIPTEKYERSGETKSKKLVERTSTVKTKDDDCASNGNPLTPNMDPKAYGAFSKVMPIAMLHTLLNHQPHFNLLTFLSFRFQTEIICSLYPNRRKEVHWIVMRLQ